MKQLLKLTGCVALAMDSYDEASSNFTEAYGEDATYDRAIQIYEAYLEKIWKRMVHDILKQR